MKELNELQVRLVAPKNNKNNFGNYNYRSLEDIMEAVKPLLKELKCTITFTDDLVMLGNRIFCKSTSTLKNENGETEISTSFAELDTHKGMSAEQASGTASSYARKYAVCSLLAIDDNTDVDSLDNSEKNTKKSINDKSNADILIEFCKGKKTEEGVNKDELTKFFKYYEPKMSNWDNKFNADLMWNKWNK